jgi:hypothetical protein
VSQASYVSRKCALSSSSISRLNALANNQPPSFGLTPSNDEWNTYQLELLRQTPCGSVDSNVQRKLHEFSQSSIGKEGLIVSHTNHTLFRGCEFLASTLTGRNASRGDHPMWERNGPAGFTFHNWRVYCNYGLDQNVMPGQPLRLISRPYCQKAPVEQASAAQRGAVGSFESRRQDFT